MYVGEIRECFYNTLLVSARSESAFQPRYRIETRELYITDSAWTLGSNHNENVKYYYCMLNC